MSNERGIPPGYVLAANGEYYKLDPAVKPPESKSIPAKRIRQSSKPLLNKLETEWLHELERRFGPGKVRVQARKFKLANGCWYCPDFTITTKQYAGDYMWDTAYEVKGKHAWDDALVKLKVAAHEWPEVRFVLVWKKDGAWMEQVVLP